MDDHNFIPQIKEGRCSWAWRVVKATFESTTVTYEPGDRWSGFSFTKREATKRATTQARIYETRLRTPPQDQEMGWITCLSPD